MSVYANIFRTITAAFDGVDYGGKTKFRSGYEKTLTGPCVKWSIGNWLAESFEPFKTKVVWDLPAEVVVPCSPGDPFPVLDALAALTNRGDLVDGLPVDAKTGKPILADRDDIEALTRQERIVTFGERLVGPALRSMRTQPTEADTGFAKIDTVWRIELVVDVTPKPRGIARQFTIGTNIGDPAGAWLKQPLGDDVEIVLPVAADTKSQGVFAKPDTTLTGGGTVYQGGYPPLVRPLPLAAGPDEDEKLKEIDVQPRTATIAALATQQLSAIGTYTNYATALLTGRVTWASSNDLVATVSASGLVTGVASGSATITATYQGVSGSAVITVS
jgi:hypothetical protein